MRLALATMTLAGSSLFFAKTIVPATTSTLARLAIYYGYPSLVNGANGDLEKAARVFSAYDVVVLGDGLEFPDQQSGRYPPGEGGLRARRDLAEQQQLTLLWIMPAA